MASIEVLYLNEAIARIFAQERRRLRSIGALIGDFDLLIGATAIHHNLTLLTNNRRHFERIEGLSIVSAWNRTLSTLVLFVDKSLRESSRPFVDG